MPVITISRQYGSGGDEIATRVCETLGYQLFDKRMVVQAAADSGFSEKEIVDFTEENHKVRSFLDRLFSRAVVMPNGYVWTEDPTGTRLMDEIRLSDDMALGLVQKAVRIAHQLGHFVIVGRGGQAILKDEQGVLHIRIEAPMETRIQRVKESLREAQGLDNTELSLRRSAQDRVIERDAASNDYLRRFYHIDWSDPLLYHVVINTGKMTLPQAIDLIVAQAREMEGATAAA